MGNKDYSVFHASMYDLPTGTELCNDGQRSHYTCGLTNVQFCAVKLLNYYVVNVDFRGGARRLPCNRALFTE